MPSESWQKYQGDRGSASSGWGGRDTPPHREWIWSLELTFLLYCKDHRNNCEQGALSAPCGRQFDEGEGCQSSVAGGLIYWLTLPVNCQISTYRPQATQLLGISDRYFVEDLMKVCCGVCKLNGRAVRRSRHWTQCDAVAEPESLSLVTSPSIDGKSHHLRIQ